MAKSQTGGGAPSKAHGIEVLFIAPIGAVPKKKKKGKGGETNRASGCCPPTICRGLLAKEARGRKREAKKRPPLKPSNHCSTVLKEREPIWPNPKIKTSKIRPTRSARKKRVSCWISCPFPNKYFQPELQSTRTKKESPRLVYRHSFVETV